MDGTYMLIMLSRGGFDIKDCMHESLERQQDNF